MRIIRILALPAAAFVSVGPLTAPPASAADLEFTVDCEEGEVVDLTVSSGESILFDLNTPACGAILEALGAAPDTFQGLIDSIVDTSGTGGTAVGDYESLCVVYTAGPRAGTDSLVLEAIFRSSARLYRIAPLGASYYMTVPGGGAGPAPWFQAVGRTDKDATCPVTYSPSSAQWPNAGTGGWVCVREYFYNSSLGDWSYRKG